MPMTETQGHDEIPLDLHLKIAEMVNFVYVLPQLIKLKPWHLFPNLKDGEKAVPPHPLGLEGRHNSSSPPGQQSISLTRH